MKTEARFYHAGCPVCIDAEAMFLNTVDKDRFEIEIVHLGQTPDRISEAESLGVKSVPALTVGPNTYHINFGASIEDLKS